MNVLLTCVSSGAPTVTLDTTNAYGFQTIGYGTATAITNLVNATATGGQSPYTYSWNQVSGDNPTLNALSANSVCWFIVSSSPQFSVSTWRCTVTDVLGKTVQSDPITVDLEISL
jgi:hypothetical protein